LVIIAKAAWTRCFLLFFAMTPWLDAPGAILAERSQPRKIQRLQRTGGETVERVLARAVSAPLARAIFKAALTEHPERRITVRRGSRVISDSRSD